MTSPRSPSVPEYLMMAEPCSECLVSTDRIVPGARAAELIKETRRGDCKFICHKAQIAGLENVACAGVREINGPCRAERFARAVGIAVVELDPETMARR